MIKLIIFDLDGVLVEARDIHYHALNRALVEVGQRFDCDIFGQQWEISREEHLAKYDGLPTRKKLAMLTKEKGVPKEYHNEIWKEKQRQTEDVIREVIKPKDHIQIANMLKALKEYGYKIYCASNSIKKSIEIMLSSAGYEKYIDGVWSNEDVNHPKPHPEIYMRAMIDAEVRPSETLIVEDSHVGRQAAHESGAHLLGIAGTHELSYEKVIKAVLHAEFKNTKKMFSPKWQGGKMNVLIPMAGEGSRFKKAGYTFPKPLIEVNGKPMIQVVIDNLNIDAHHIFICQHKHLEKYNLTTVLPMIAKNCVIYPLAKVTEGAACTTLVAQEHIDNDEPLLIANSDQFIDWNSNEFMYAVTNDEIDGGILTFKSVHPKWSYAKVDDNGFVTEVAEKKPISDNATVGVYYWRRGSDYVKYAKQMIEKNIRVNNEFYVCPVFNEAIQDGKKFKIFPVDKMWGLGTPEDLEVFLKENHE
jgi:HAD superfamily hydrolase (TIGR01509 family)